jgi:hypothetical protein
MQNTPDFDSDEEDLKVFYNQARTCVLGSEEQQLQENVLVLDRFVVLKSLGTSLH